ncbi:hypothetical protein Mal52_46820 [Symmachiella dynata]|uniref:Inverse autotransporter beta-domain domain-containing protein n=1 Tax=Symmachiella dynata TaxID=2527995 RepID=A0A517ZUM2_9PLAN|nr:inverse autotransporter beta domain-containing protein [Symmachiella dynata]QDU46183.1 hypothetical protein Mal52_46820 [Symmachiella dynata]
MNTRRVNVPLRIVLITAMLWSPVHAADDAGSVRLANNETTGTAYVTPTSWSTESMNGGPTGMTSVGSPGPSRAADPFGIQFRFRSDIQPSFVKDGYQTLGAMVPFHIDPGTSLVFIEGRGYATNHAEYGGNVGLGYRYYSEMMNRMYSISGWWDYDDSNVFNYDRWGISLASLTDNGLDYRVNAYIADNTAGKFVGRTTGIPIFSGYNIGQATDSLYEVPYSGFDAEIGMPVPFLGDYGIKVYAGGYYMQAEGEKDASGPKVRLQGDITESIWGQVEWTSDSVFGSNVMGSVAIDFPGGGRRPAFTRQPTNMMLAQQVQRQYRVPVNEKVVRESSVAINPVDMEPFIVYHVDNTAPGSGDGSAEAPYSTLPGSVPSEADIIFVNRGDGTSSGMTGDFFLQDDQRLLGEGTVHFYTSTAGTFEMPGYTPGVNPLLGGTVSMLGDRVEVAGFRFAVPDGQPAIFGSGDDFLIREVAVSGGGRGVDLMNATGVGLITDSTFVGTGADSIRAENADGTTLDLAIIDTIIADGDEDGVYVTVDTAATINLLMDNVDVSGVAGNGFGTDVSFFNTTLAVDVFNSSFSNNFGDGFFVERVDDSGFSINIADSTFDNNGRNGVSIFSYNGRVPNGMVDIVRSSMSDNANIGLQLHGEADVTLDVDLADNFINRNGFGGIQMTSAERILLQGVWERNEINNNGYDDAVGDGDGIFLQSNLDLVLTDNDVLANNGDGLQVEIFGAASTILDLNGNRINNNLGAGFDWESIFGSSLLLMDVDASATRISQFNNNDGDGMEFRSNGLSGFADFVVATINDTEINFNEGRGVDLLTQEDAGMEIYITDSQISANGEEGVYLVNTASGTQTQDVSSSVALADDGLIDTIPTTTLVIDNSEIDANGTIGTMGGVVIRVGTSDGGRSYTFDGGYASDGYGGVIAGLTNSMLSGNYGEDLVIESFTSTVDPPDTDGTWTDAEFTVDNYESDPLARIDVVFHGNTADSIDVINFGAFYDNAEAVFKSRDVDQTDPGPFTDPARRRNATRLAARDGLPPATPGGASDTFLYPGIGESTMRVEGPLPGIEDGVDILDPGFGGGVILGVLPGEFPFVWQVVPPGTIFP